MAADPGAPPVPGDPLDQRYALRAVFWSLTSAWSLVGDAGDRLMSRRRATRLKTLLEVRRGDALVLRVRATRWTHVAARFEVEDGAGGVIGALEREVVRSLGRDHWRIEDARSPIGAMIEAGHPFLARAIPLWPRAHDVLLERAGDRDPARTIATIAASWRPTRARLWIAADAPRSARQLALAACLIAIHSGAQV